MLWSYVGSEYSFLPEHRGLEKLDSWSGLSLGLGLGPGPGYLSWSGLSLGLGLGPRPGYLS